MKTVLGDGRRPFWLPASNYYVLAFAISIAFFFLVWGILHDGGDEMPWAAAGVGASLILIASVVLRELILLRPGRRARSHRPIGTSNSRPSTWNSRDSEKLTLEKNAAILGEIQRKSDAANVLDRLSAGHREVFELCGAYMTRNESELKSVNPGSPRLTALLRGRSAVAEFHKYHLLKWAQLEVHGLTNEARQHDDVAEKKLAAKAALNVIDTALKSYPLEESLIESQELLQDMIVSISVSDWIERAEKAVYEGDNPQARELYREALFFLGRDTVRSEVRDVLADRIRKKLDSLGKENGI